MPVRNNLESWQAFGVAAALELALLVGAAVILGGASQTRSALSETMAIELENAVQPSTQPPEPKPQRPVPPRKTTPPPQQAQQPQQPPTPEAAQPTAFSEPTPPPPAPAAAASAAPVRPSDVYAGKVHTAVQAAHYYPPAAEALHYAGRVRVEFHLRDGIPEAERVLVSSGFSVIDRAALQAVQGAHYPETPPELRGSDLIFQVWVEFDRQS